MKWKLQCDEEEATEINRPLPRYICTTGSKAQACAISPHLVSRLCAAAQCYCCEMPKWWDMKKHYVWVNFEKGYVISMHDSILYILAHHQLFKYHYINHQLCCDFLVLYICIIPNNSAFEVYKGLQNLPNKYGHVQGRVLTIIMIRYKQIDRKFNRYIKLDNLKACGHYSFLISHTYFLTFSSP